jgi:hypothetical protein
MTSFTIKLRPGETPKKIMKGYSKSYCCDDSYDTVLYAKFLKELSVGISGSSHAALKRKLASRIFRISEEDVYECYEFIFKHLAKIVTVTENGEKVHDFRLKSLLSDIEDCIVTYLDISGNNHIEFLKIYDWLTKEYEVISCLNNHCHEYKQIEKRLKASKIPFSSFLDLFAFKECDIPIRKIMFSDIDFYDFRIGVGLE